MPPNKGMELTGAARRQLIPKAFAMSNSPIVCCFWKRACSASAWVMKA